MSTAAIERKLGELIEQYFNENVLHPSFKNVPGKIMTDSELKAIPSAHRAFFKQTAPLLSFSQYINRLISYMHCTPEVFIIATALVLRAAGKDAAHPVSQPVLLIRNSMYRMFLAACVLGAKLRDDLYYSMSFYSQVGGVSPSELRSAERSLLAVLNWDIHVSVERYAEIMSVLSSQSCGDCSGCKAARSASPRSPLVATMSSPECSLSVTSDDDDCMTVELNSMSISDEDFGSMCSSCLVLPTGMYVPEVEQFQ